jgi:hypothetical protein
MFFSTANPSLSPELKWQSREVDHSPPFTAEIKKVQPIPPFPSYVFMAQC